MQLKEYIYKACVHNGEYIYPTCGKIHAYDYDQAEQDVINMLVDFKSNDLTDFIIREAKNVPKQCALITNLCKNCCIK